MDFLSRKKSPSYVLHHGWSKQVAADGGVLRSARPSAIIHFEPLKIPRETRQLSGKDNLARGKLLVSKALTEIRSRGWHDVTEDDIIQHLRRHPDFETRQIAYIGGDVEALGVDWIVPEPEGGKLYCRLCDKHDIGAAGRKFHENSHKHQELLKAERAKSREAMDQESIAAQLTKLVSKDAEATRPADVST